MPAIHRPSPPPAILRDYSTEAGGDAHMCSLMNAFVGQAAVSLRGRQLSIACRPGDVSDNALIRLGLPTVDMHRKLRLLHEYSLGCRSASPHLDQITKTLRKILGEKTLLKVTLGVPTRV